MTTSSFLPSEYSPAAFQFSICCIVTRMEEYEDMKKSFEERGFDHCCEYLIADNTQGNQFDAFVAVNRFLKESRGEYIIIVHQDVRCVDMASKLLEILSTLTQQDPAWAVCGNAGAAGYHQDLRFIINGGKIVKHDNLPARVYSLDENFLVIRNHVNIAVSADLRGFHFYATDLCLIADYLGYSVYVIPFMVKHFSLGDLKGIKQQQKEFLERYGRKLRSRFVQTPSTKFVLLGSPFYNKIFNGPFFFLVKWAEGFKLLFSRRHKQLYKKHVDTE